MPTYRVTGNSGVFIRNAKVSAGKTVELDYYLNLNNYDDGVVEKISDDPQINYPIELCPVNSVGDVTDIYDILDYNYIHISAPSAQEGETVILDVFGGVNDDPSTFIHTGVSFTFTINNINGHLFPIPSGVPQFKKLDLGPYLFYIIVVHDKTINGEINIIIKR